MVEDAWNDDEEDGSGEADEVHESPDDDEETTTPCPSCRRPIYEDSYRCPHCGHYLSAEDTAPSARKPWWIIVGSLLIFYVVYRWIAG